MNGRTISAKLRIADNQFELRPITEEYVKIRYETLPQPMPSWKKF